MRRNADFANARAVVKKRLKSFRVLPVDRQSLELASTHSTSDFEDNLQIACAVLARLDAIVTRDTSGFAGSPVPMLAPTELLARILQGPSV